MVILKGMKKNLMEVKLMNKVDDSPIDELDFMLWKQELNKELLLFWKSLK